MITFNTDTKHKRVLKHTALGVILFGGFATFLFFISFHFIALFPLGVLLVIISITAGSLKDQSLEFGESHLTLHINKTHKTSISFSTLSYHHSEWRSYDKGLKICGTDTEIFLWKNDFAEVEWNQLIKTLKPFKKDQKLEFYASTKPKNKFIQTNT
jgi:hypothetical protein